jgi:ABC-type Fe3+/spermidine/putrescine transport system ATPase subunit
MSAIRVNTLCKEFPGSAVALDDVSFEVEPGAFVSLLGPSGCGKTTMLRCIAGLESPDSGEIEVSGRVVYSSIGSKQVMVAPEKRALSMVFQQYALWPHMSVFDNVAFGLTMRRASKADTKAKVRKALESVELWHVRERKISALSGGQQQRIAVARAIAFDPAVILFDEPLSNLDANLREAMRLQLLELQQELGFTALYVTHDQAEAMSLSDRILVLNQGRVEQDASPPEIWNTPGTSFVARFIGSSNIYEGKVRANSTGNVTITLDNGLNVVARGRDLTVGQQAEVFIRFNDLVVERERPIADNVWEASVFLASYQGHESVLKLRTADGVELVALVPSSSEFARGERVFVSTSAEHVRTFATGKARVGDDRTVQSIVAAT